MSFPMRFLGLSFISSSQEAMQKKDGNTIRNIGPRAMVNVSENLDFKRMALPTDNGKNADWHNTFVYAWEDGKTVDQMERVIWTLIDPVTKRSGWLMWDSVTNMPKLRDDHKQEWTPTTPQLWTPVN